MVICNSEAVVCFGVGSPEHIEKIYLGARFLPNSCISILQKNRATCKRVDANSILLECVGCKDKNDARPGETYLIVETIRRLG